VTRRGAARLHWLAEGVVVQLAHLLDSRAGEVRAAARAAAAERARLDEVLSLSVQLTPDTTAPLVLRRGETPAAAAAAFVDRLGLPHDVVPTLVSAIQARLAALQAGAQRA
jgi:hypothetical protein